MKPFITLTAFISLALISNFTSAQSNSSLIPKLDTILENDQRFRRIKNASPAQDQENMRQQRLLDIRNLVEVEKIFARYGYPGKSMVGEQHQSTAFLVIQHSDQDVQEKYLPLISRAADLGELRASSLAILIDRVKTGRGEKQVYGSQMHETKDGIKIYPIEDEANVNTRRAKIGLPSIEDYYKEWNIPYKVPTSSYQNPPEMYYHPEQREELAIEAIGGDQGIFARLLYPAKAKAAHVKGTVTVEFTVAKDGSTKNISIVKGLGYGCDEEAIRVIKQTKYVNKTGEDHDLRIRLPFPYTHMQKAQRSQ